MQKKGLKRPQQPFGDRRLRASPTPRTTSTNDLAGAELGRATPEMQRYNRVVAAAELSVILMTKSRSEAALNAQQLLDLAEEGAFTGIVHIDHSVSGNSFHPDRGMASCIVSFQLSISGGEDRQALFNTSCEFSVVYRGLEGQDSGAIERFINRVAQFAAYPYFRAYVSHVVSLTDIKMPPLPVLKEKTQN
jgi:hypothetical protein